MLLSFCFWTSPFSRHIGSSQKASAEPSVSLVVQMPDGLSDDLGMKIVVSFSLGAFGYFEVTHDITKYSKAKVFEHIGKKTPIAVRFSTVGKSVCLHD